LQRKQAERKGKLVMCGLRDNLMKVFKLTRLDKLLTFKKDEQAALAVFDVFTK
jgi:anti-anti-sigma regulatory factor